MKDMRVERSLQRRKAIPCFERLGPQGVREGACGGGRGRGVGGGRTTPTGARGSRRQNRERLSPSREPEGPKKNSPREVEARGQDGSGV